LNNCRRSVSGVKAGHIALFIANLIYGINYIFAKDVMPDNIEPFGFILYRGVGAFLIFFTLYRVFFYEKVERKDIGRIFVCAMFGIVANQLMFFYGLNLTNPINASIMMTTNPVLVLIVSSILLKSKLTFSKIFGVILGITGAVVLILQNGSISFDSATTEGDVFIFLNALSYGIYLVLAKPLMKKYQPLTIVTWVFGIGLIFVIPIGYSEAAAVNWAEMDMDILKKVMYVIICTTVIAYFLNIYALKRLSPGIVSTYLYLQPVFAATVAILLNRTTLNYIQVLATIIIFVGVYFVSKQTKSEIN